MKKNGFTLQELLISMAIIGLIAAAIAPAINSIMPDKRKAMYMKAYNTLTNVTNEILSDPALFWTTYDSDTGEATCSGLGCDSLPTTYAPCNEVGWKCEGENKFPMIFATKVNYVERNSPITGSKLISDVKTIDGIYWVFRATNTATKNTEFRVLIDVNYKNDNINNKCSYSSTCPNPDKFEFTIDNDGGITAVDALGKAFLENPTDMKSIREDKERAKELYKSTISRPTIGGPSRPTIGGPSGFGGSGFGGSGAIPNRPRPSTGTIGGTSGFGGSGAIPNRPTNSN